MTSANTSGSFDFFTFASVRAALIRFRLAIYAPVRGRRSGLPATHLLIDRDAKFTRPFDAVFEADQTEVKRVGPKARR